MTRIFPVRGLRFMALICTLPALLAAQSGKPLGWDEVKTRFEASNPALHADALNVDEMKAAEITANLRPNPQYSFTMDGTQIAPAKGVWQPLTGSSYQNTLSYLHEREHKRELRHQSAEQATRVAQAQHEDLRRNLEFTLRTAFINTLEAKEVLRLAVADLAYYDKIIAISRERFRAGDLAQIDLDRIELLRVQYESELEQAKVNLRTAKIQLLQLINDRTPVEQFDVTGSFDFTTGLKPLEEFRAAALEARPDLAAALEAVRQSELNHKLALANGSTDPTLSGWTTSNSSTNNANAYQTVGFSVSIPLRLFDRNQGEKQRTALDIDRAKELTEATRAQLFSDVDSAYAQLEGAITQLKPYKAQYNAQALRVRDTVTYSWQHGGSSLMDFLNAQSDARAVELAYAQLVGSYLNAAAQLNLAVGREVLP